MKRTTLTAGLVLFLSLSVLFACGSDSRSAINGATITINPGDTKVTDTTATTGWYVSPPYTVTVKDSTGAPMNKVQLIIDYQWAVPNPPGFVQLLDRHGNPVSSPYSGAETDAFGTYTFSLRYLSGGGLAYKADLEARSGTAFAAVNFEVSAN